jgi:hypothetical protein
VSRPFVEECVRLPVFPRCPDNRPGLSEIAYRAGTYAEIREALLFHLNRHPVLQNWTHRGADDPGIALLEGAAILPPSWATSSPSTRSCTPTRRTCAPPSGARASPTSSG